MQHVTTLKVRGYHIDLFGHVNHARFLELLEEARWRFFEERIGTDSLTKSETPVVVVNINIAYKRPAFAEQLLRIETATQKIGNTSATLKQRIFLNDTTDELVNADVTFVAIDRHTGAPVSIPALVREMLEQAR